MISVGEAKKLISENIATLSPILLNLREAAGHILAQDIYAHYDIPAFKQSSMDGYAIIFGDKNELNLVGEMAAGTQKKINLTAGKTSRIFTGAPLPDGADTVIMQEKTTRVGNIIRFESENITKGLNVRAIGSEIKSGELAMKNGDLLTPAAVGFLAGIGINKVKVFPMPRIAIILTGNELLQPGLMLCFGQVYESNSYTLSAALNKEQIFNIEILEAEDNLDTLTEILQKALNSNDVVLLTGGVSVGDYDYVIEASKNCGIKQLFHKIKQKPGKPLFFGKKGEKLIFGLPGNPSSVLSCFYNYVLPGLKRLSNKENNLVQLEATLTHHYKKPKGLTHFLKGNYEDGKATPLGAQESYRLSSFAQANCLIVLDEIQDFFEVGETVSIILLPN
ncbi:gephyrin-like molybdotransferase Glp [Pedobacter nototheniae]|uniref:molybdopterin molybdotransferase MoeA n=1 Tax=Pedobacter nototheniae TaxID=2488994 RepID=UPI0029318C02|nr:gephyrin-like molybdotransferase Glp [Pedobacter nototheniae]